jgi:hypothetical protein
MNFVLVWVLNKILNQIYRRNKYKKQVITSGFAPNRILIKTFLKKQLIQVMVA